MRTDSTPFGRSLNSQPIEKRGRTGTEAKPSCSAMFYELEFATHRFIESGLGSEEQFLVRVLQKVLLHMPT